MYLYLLYSTQLSFPLYPVEMVTGEAVAHKDGWKAQSFQVGEGQILTGSSCLKYLPGKTQNSVLKAYANQ